MRIKSLAEAGAEADVVVTDVGGVLEAELKEATVATSQAVPVRERSSTKILISLLAAAKRV